MRGLLRRAAVCICAAVVLFVAGASAEASAGTLGSPIWALSDNVGSATDAQYRWDFTTATSSGLTDVMATVPSGTRGTTPSFLGVHNAGDFVSTPDTTTNSVTGDIDLRAKASLVDWTPGDYQTIISKWTGGQRGYDFYVYPGGDLAMMTSNDGSAYIEAISTAAPSVADGATLWVRATRDVDNGAGGNTTTFYTSADGTTWNQLGAPVVISGATTIYDNTQPVMVGASWGGSADPLDGRVYSATVLNGINGSVAATFDPTRVIDGSSSWSGSLGETWTITQTSVTGSDIVSDLTVNGVGGVPAGGVARYRYSSRSVDYTFASTSVPASTASYVIVSGLVNTPAGGTYSSVITTRNSSAVDSATTNSVTIQGNTAGASVGVAIDPSLVFTVAAHSGSCNGVAQTGSATSTSVTLGHPTASVNAVAAQDLAVATNGAGGFTVSARSTGAFTNSGGATIAAVGAGNASPVAFSAPGTAGVGYSSSDATLTGGTANRFTNGGAKWAAMTTSDAPVSSETAAGSSTVCIAYQVGVASTTPAGAYSMSVIYTATPTF